MLIKVVNFSRKERQRPADLKRQLRYLFSPKISRESPDKPHPGRLLGPPVYHRLATAALPWGDGVRQAANDLADQMFRHCREACAGKPMPHRSYVHIIISFAPAAKRALAAPLDPHDVPPKAWSMAGNALRVAFDALDYLGWEREQPAVFVVHGDRRHVHVHAVIALPIKQGRTWDILGFSRKQIDEWAKITCDAFNLPLGSGKTARKHQQRWEAMAWR